MKRTLFTAVCLVILLAFCAGFACALELEITGGANFLTFDPDQKTSYSGRISDKTDPDYDADKLEFDPHLFAIGSIILRNELNENLAFSINLERDNILHNSIGGLLISKADYFSFGVGPFLRITDDFDKPFIGILCEVNFQYPGVVFLNLSGSITITDLKDEVDFLSDDSSSAYSVKLGFWLPSVIPHISASFKKLTREIDDDLTKADSLTRYQAGVDIYTKNFPLIIKLAAGYQIYTRSYKGTTEKNNDDINSVFTGFELSYQLNKQLNLLFGAEIPIYLEEDKPMKLPAWYTMPKVSAGVVFSF